MKGNPMGNAGEYRSSRLSVVGAPGIPGLLLANKQRGNVEGELTA